MKFGINFKIDVTKIDKEKLFIGKNGAKYLDATAFVNVNESDKYGNNGIINQAKNKGDENNGPILGNCKVFWSSDAQQSSYKPQQQEHKHFDSSSFEDDIPF